jgi:hypothetical protein
MLFTIIDALKSFCVQIKTDQFKQICGYHFINIELNERNLIQWHCFNVYECHIVEEVRRRIDVMDHTLRIAHSWPVQLMCWG